MQNETTQQPARHSSTPTSSDGSPLTNGIGTGAKLGLASLHLVVGAIVILGLRRTTLTAAERC
jgi:hypothetical protein